ncbi:monovalent cation:proton antiporter-2 (CPA2) family protein [Bdellovibrio bacteriovorus]|uniref:monovalent cation:proton antiporter-2 (CPA2) family protein n=1 Tax=Bdellovibrio bacteriovorus TaxID=959 RepID=UPI0035A5EC79
MLVTGILPGSRQLDTFDNMILHEQLLQILAFLGFSVVLVSLFQKLGLGTILGYLAAGILIGPLGWGLISDFHFVQTIAEFGVVFLLFIIGLELQPKKLWGLRKTLLGFGGLQILACTVVFTVVGYQLGISWASAAVVGFALSLSSTAFALQSLSERKVLNTEFGRASFAILLMQDVVAIPALAVIPSLGLVTASTREVNWGGALAIFIGLALGSRILMGRFLQVVAETRSRELFTGVTLLTVIGVAFLMESVGLSMALGAFLAGVLLSESEYRHELEADLEPFKGLLMGLFFVSVGMSVKLSLLIENPGLILGITVGYMVLKGFLIYGVGRVMKLHRPASNNLAVYLVQGGEFAFVIFGVGQSAQVLSPEWTQRFTLVVTLSMIASPIIIVLNEKIQAMIACKSPAGGGPQYDKIDEGDSGNAVIIAGFGRVGQIFGRVLRTQDVKFTAIEHDTEQIDMLRRFGNKVYYGDASRPEILEAAGIKNAKFFVLAVDDVETSNKIAQVLRDDYPHVKVFARSRNRQHTFDLMEAGVAYVRRETIDSSIALSEQLLVAMGTPVKRAHEIIERFRLHDELMLQEQFKVRHDQKTFIDVSRQAAQQLAQVLKEDAEKTYIDPQHPPEASN